VRRLNVRFWPKADIRSSNAAHTRLIFYGAVITWAEYSAAFLISSENWRRL